MFAALIVNENILLLVHEFCQLFQDNTALTEGNKYLRDSSFQRVSNSEKYELFFCILSALQNFYTVPHSRVFHTASLV